MTQKKIQKKIMCVLLSLAMVLTLLPGTALAKDGQGLAVMWNEQLLYDGNGSNQQTIQIPECSGESLRIYFDGTAVDTYRWAMGESTDENICYAGVSPDSKWLEVYLNTNARAGNSCNVTLYYGEKDSSVSATYRIEVVPGVRLQRDNKTLIYPNGSLGSSQAMTVQLTMGDQNITDEYSVSTNGNAVLRASDQGNGNIKLTPTGNGSADLIVQYGGREYVYRWTTEGLSDETATSNIRITMDDGRTFLPGDTIRMDGETTLTGNVSFNGSTLNGYTLQIPGDEDRCSVTTGENGSFTLTSSNSDGYCDLVLSCNKDSRQYEAVFEVQVQAPTAYYLQFYNMEEQSDGSFIHNGGFSTLGVFEKRQDKHIKFIVTDQDMRRVGEDHFVNVTPASLKVMAFDTKKKDYVEVSDKHNPFTITADTNDSQMLHISYNHEKDSKYGPAYMLVYTDYENDKYLKQGSDDFYVDNTIFLWTKSVADFVKWDRLSHDQGRWKYNATVDTYEGFEKQNDDCTVKRAVVDIPQNMFGAGDEQIPVTADTTLEIQTDVGNVTLDTTMLEMMQEKKQDTTLKIMQVEEEDEEYTEAASSLTGTTCVVDLKLDSGEENIHDFGSGTATIQLSYAAARGKIPQVYYVQASGTKEPVPCNYDAVKGSLTFETNHFSLFAVAEEDAGISGGTGGSAAPSDQITQSGSSTTADLSGNTVSKGGETTTTVAQTTADKLVETAVKNNSEEIIVDAVTKNPSAAGSTKSAEVILSGDTLKDIAEKTEADVVIRTNVAEVRLDAATVKAAASQAAPGETVSIVAKKVKEAAKEIRFELKIVTGSGKVISDFQGGNVAVTVSVPKSLSGKKLTCVYIDENGYMHRVEGAMNADGTYTFTTGHFSQYALMDEEDAESAIQAQKAEVEAVKLTLRSRLVKMKSGKRAIKLTWKGGEDIHLDGIEIYRSTKRSTGYGKKPFFTTTKTAYYNTAARAGKRYYYKVRGFVTIDGEKVYTRYSTKAWRTVK